MKIFGYPVVEIDAPEAEGTKILFSDWKKWTGRIDLGRPFVVDEEMPCPVCCDVPRDLSDRFCACCHGAGIIVTPKPKG